MPIDRYTTDDPFGNHPLFKSEEQARFEETLGGTEPAWRLRLPGFALARRGNQGQRERARGQPSAPEFDWGD